MPRPTPKLEDHPLSATRDFLLNLFAATLHIGGCSSICNLRTRHAVVTGTHKHGVIWSKQAKYSIVPFGISNSMTRSRELVRDLL